MLTNTCSYPVDRKKPRPANPLTPYTVPPFSFIISHLNPIQSNHFLFDQIFFFPITHFNNCSSKPNQQPFDLFFKDSKSNLCSPKSVYHRNKVQTRHPIT
ncbi:hypothetical protein QVD17_27470 [Tagetes erecta]|uniref:Uncharacterized protein n=1 Tax=Tagetes erecta TaxID=13708 RepID=A0AAD8K8R1_TARER|nr:hypothetical protein QVD17_27470 [Tagetes erecta]